MGKVQQRLLFSFQVFFTFLLQINIVCAQIRYNIQHYTNENGLPTNNIKGIEYDPRTGFLWIGSQAGLVRFDGRSFENIGSSGDLANVRIAHIAKNREGAIYVEDDNFSIYRIKGSRSEFVMNDTVYYAFYQSKRWQTLYKAVNQIKEILKNHKRPSFLPAWVIFNEEHRADNSFSFVHFKQAYHYDAISDTLHKFPHCNQILKIKRDIYFVDTTLHLWQYNSSTKMLQPAYVEDMPVWKKDAVSKPKIIWKRGMKDPLLFYRQNIWKLTREKNTIRLLPICTTCYPAGVSIDFAELAEKQEVIILGSEASGLYVLKSSFVSSVHLPDTLPEGKKTEYAQIEITPGIINTASGLSYSTDGKLLSGKPKIQFPGGNNIYKDWHGNYWFSSMDTVLNYQPKTDQYHKIPVSDGSEKIIFAENQGHFYVFSDVAFGEIVNGKYKRLYKLPYIASEKKNWLNPDAAVALRPGVFAIASEKLLLFDTKKRNELITVPIPNLNVKVRALLKYGDYLLVGTYGQGFYLYKNGKIKKMPLDKKMYLSYVHCFLPDGKGFCWISTNRGFFKVSMKALEAAYENDLNEIYYHHFDKDDGIYNIELNGGCQPCGLQMSNGVYSFPSMNGVVTFDPNKRHIPPPSGQIFVDEIFVDSAVYHLNDNALTDLPYDLKNLRFKLSLPYFGNIENIYFSYKLEPYHDNWEQLDITQNNTLYFGRLKPGKYKLYLRVRNGFEADQYKVTVINFRILTPWYQSEWFYVACILAVVALFWGLLKWRTARIERRKQELQILVTQQTEDIAVQSKQLENQLGQLQTQQTKLEEDNKIKSRLISIISHDMISPLKFIGYLSKTTLDDIHLSNETRRVIGYMASVAQDMESLTVNLLNWIRFHHESLEMEPEEFNLYTLVKESVEIAVTLAHQKEIDFTIDIPENTEVCQFRQAIGVIIYNLTMNAVKHTTAGGIKIRSNFASDCFIIFITDTGWGIPAETVEQLNDPEFFDFTYATSDSKKYQFGYIIIKDLLRLSNGDIKVESILGKGTTVALKFLDMKNVR